MKILTLLLTCVCALFGADYSIVFIHLGPKLPDYSIDSINQAHLFNPNAKIYLLANEAALINRVFENAIPVTIESIPRSAEHRDFIKRCNYPGDLWRYSSERFLVLDDFLEQTRLESVFHLENDVMLYADLSLMMPAFDKYKIGATFDNDVRCIPGFIYFKNSQAIKPLAKHFVSHFMALGQDMKVIADFKNTAGSYYIKSLPIIFPSYASYYPLKSDKGHVAKNPASYSLNYDQFHSIFDAAAIGQYLGGIDPIHHNNGAGFVNESCVFNPSYFTYEWQRDDQGRKVPYLLFQNEKIRINNLHIHCKNLKKFAS